MRTNDEVAAVVELVVDESSVGVAGRSWSEIEDMQESQLSHIMQKS